MSLERLSTLFTLVPAATSTSYIVTVGPAVRVDHAGVDAERRERVAERLDDAALVGAVVRRGRRHAEQVERWELVRALRRGDGASLRLLGLRDPAGASASSAAGGSARAATRGSGSEPASGRTMTGSSISPNASRIFVVASLGSAGVDGAAASAGLGARHRAEGERARDAPGPARLARPRRGPAPGSSASRRCGATASSSSVDQRRP